MNEKEFLDGLKEDKWFNNPNELIEHRFPFIQYYLKNKTNSQLITPMGIIDSKLVELIYKEDEYAQINQAFVAIKQQFINEKI
jgi:hypothetical protein